METNQSRRSNRQVSRRTWSTAQSIHIGIDRIRTDLYRNLLPELSAAEADARVMRDVADSMGAATRLLLSEEATRDSVVIALESAIERMEPGDVLLVSFAGHMVSLAGIAGEADGSDEAWCLYDGVLLDNEFLDLLSAVPKQSDVIVVTDSCFAEGIIDAPLADGRSTIEQGDPVPVRNRSAPTRFRLKPMFLPTVASDVERPKFLVRAPIRRDADIEIGNLVGSGQIPSGARRRGIAPRLVARLIALSATSEESLAFEGDKQGLFTSALKEVLQSGEGAITYADLIEQVASLIPVQSPTIGLFGSAPRSMLSEPAFSANVRPKPIRGSELRNLKRT